MIYLDAKSSSEILRVIFNYFKAVSLGLLPSISDEMCQYLACIKPNAKLIKCLIAVTCSHTKATACTLVAVYNQPYYP